MSKKKSAFKKKWSKHLPVLPGWIIDVAVLLVVALFAWRLIDAFLQWYLWIG